LKRLLRYFIAGSNRKPDNELVHLADTALRLARFFGTSAEFWLGLQAQYDLDITAEVLGDRLEKEVKTYANAR
jgi:plasmid maintenance system antidote protein VapI